MKFNFEKYKDTDKKKYCMHCKTKEEAEDFCSVLSESGRRWSDGTKYLEFSRFNLFKNETVYLFNKGLYGNRYSAFNCGYTILEWSDFMKKEFTKEDLKNGDVVVLRNNNVGVILPQLGAIVLKDGVFDMRGLSDDFLACTGAKLDCDIMDVYRPQKSWQCQFHKEAYLKGEHVYHRDESPVEITIEEIARLKGVSATRIRIKGYEKKRQEHDYIF